MGKIAKVLAVFSVLYIEDSSFCCTLGQSWETVRRMIVTDLLNDWLFTGVTASAVLMSISTLQPGHPLAIVARSLGYGMALLCIPTAGVAFWLRQRRGRAQS